MISKMIPDRWTTAALSAKSDGLQNSKKMLAIVNERTRVVKTGFADGLNMPQHAFMHVFFVLQGYSIK